MCKTIMFLFILQGYISNLSSWVFEISGEEIILTGKIQAAGDHGVRCFTFCYFLYCQVD